MNAALTWDVVRASGFAAYGLVTLSIVFGLLLSQRAQSRDHWPRFVNQELHQYTLLLAGMLSAVHGISAWLDPFMKFHWYEVLIPFKSHYRPLWMALGIVSLYLGMAVGLSTWLRPRIGYKVWRMFHYVNYLVFVLVTLHGLGTGSDTRTGWAMADYAGSVAVVAGLTLWRLWQPAGGQANRHPRTMLAVSGVLTAGVLWAVSRPLQPGWNRIANNGHGSGARIPAAYVSASTLPVPIRTSVQGTFTEAQQQSGAIALDLQARVSGTEPGTIAVQLLGQATYGNSISIGGGKALWEHGQPQQLFFQPACHIP